MKTNKLMFSSILFSLFFIQCGPIPIDEDIPNASHRLSVNAIFSCDSIWSVYVTSGRDILDNTYTTLGSAHILILEEDQPLATLILQAPDVMVGSLYVSDKGSDLEPQPGKRYTIKASHEGFNDIQATCYVPIPVPITKVENLTDGNEIEQRKAYVYFDDPADEENYYEIVQRMEYKHVMEDGTVTQSIVETDVTTSDPLFYHDSTPIELFDDSKENLPVFFNDKGLNGKSLKILVEMDPNFDYGTLTHKGRIILRSLSKEYYEYKSTLILQQDVSGDKFAQPVDVYNNIQNGFGIFAGYSEFMY